MTKLTPMSELVRDRNYDLGTDTTAIVGMHAYGSNNERIGTVREALTEDGGTLRYLVLEVGNWFTSKEVVVPVGLARIEGDGVYFDSLTKDQVKDMNTYVAGQDYAPEHQVADERVLRGTGYTGQMATQGDTSTRDNDAMFRAPQTLQLLEERLSVNKERYVAGQVEIGKRVETRTENVNVDLVQEEVVIERHAVTDARPVAGNVTLGADSQTIRVDLEAERATLNKQAYVTEEVEVGKRSETERQTLSGTVGKEVLEVTKTGETEVVRDGQQTSQTSGTSGRNAVERGVDAVKDAVDPLDGKIDRR